jgi:hypothetical protein
MTRMPDDVAIVAIYPLSSHRISEDKKVCVRISASQH